MRYALIVLLALVTACHATYSGDETSRFYPPPAGSRLILKQRLTIPAETAGVFIQGGRAVSSREVNQYHPHCRLEVHERRDTSQTVDPDEFLVRRVRREVQTVSRPGLLPAANTSGRTSFWIYRTLLDLQSPRQPQVRVLVCQHWGEPPLDDHLSIRDIRRALGDVMTLELPVADPSAPAQN